LNSVKYKEFDHLAMKFSFSSARAHKLGMGSLTLQWLNLAWTIRIVGFSIPKFYVGFKF